MVIIYLTCSKVEPLAPTVQLDAMIEIHKRSRQGLKVLDHGMFHFEVRLGSFLVVALGAFLTGEPKGE